MNHTTEEILYIKYANERNREFAVRTEILENIDGKRSVKKTPLYPEGKAHVAGLVEKYHRLEPDYEKVGMFCNRAEADGDSVRLEYLMGESMEEYLDGLLDGGISSRFLFLEEFSILSVSEQIIKERSN